jgi:hypothetical protein
MIGIIGKIFESSFLINLFGDTNIVRIFYKSNQTYGIKNRKRQLNWDRGVMTTGEPNKPV